MIFLFNEIPRKSQGTSAFRVLYVLHDAKNAVKISSYARKENETKICSYVATSTYIMLQLLIMYC